MSGQIVSCVGVQEPEKILHQTLVLLNGALENIQRGKFVQVAGHRSPSSRVILQFEDLKARAAVLWFVGNEDAVKFGPLVADLCQQRIKFCADKFGKI